MILRTPSHLKGVRTLVRLQVLALLLLAIGLAGCGHGILCQDCEFWASERGRATVFGDVAEPLYGPSMRRLARELTELENKLGHHGSITVKQPDVWGETNLMGYIQEYEQVMLNRLGDYQQTLQGFLARGDQAELQSVTSFGADISRRSAGASSAAGGGGGGASNTVVVPIPFEKTSQGVDNVKPIDLKTSDLFDLLSKSLGQARGPSPTASIEPTMALRQNSAYVKANQGLRRINTGDDNSMAAGYGLYLLRVPVSILPGRVTQEGYAAEVTMRAQMVIDDNHLRVTFPKLVVGELAERLAGPILQNWSRPKIDVKPDARSAFETLKMPIPTQSLRLDPVHSLSGMVPIFGEDALNTLFDEVKKSFGGPSQPPPVDAIKNKLFALLLEHRGYLEAYANEGLDVYGDIPGMVQALRKGESLDSYRVSFQQKLNGTNVGATKRGLSWILLAQSALIELQIKDIMLEMSKAGNLPATTEQIYSLSLADPRTTSEARFVWSAFVNSQYPLYVFHLDPVADDQNIYDAFSRRRELQLAMAFAVANGRLRADQALKFSRQLALDAVTIGLNRTQVAFAHGHDTFGWKFYPRMQTPPVERSNIAAVARLLWSGGPTDRYDLRHRKLEPGLRECEVLVVMPNFVPSVKLDVTANWERLDRPGKIKMDYEDMIRLGERVVALRDLATQVGDQCRYRSGDYERLVSRVEQLERMLPLQSHFVRLPFQYDLPATQLFDTGTVFLRPQIDGYYGIRFITREDSNATEVEFFLTGHNFHPTRTHVIVGGKESHSIPGTVKIAASADGKYQDTLNSAAVEVITRNLIKVKVQGISSKWSTGKIPVRVATPGGLSNELEIDPAPTSPKPQLGFEMKTTTLTVFYAWDFVKGRPEIKATRDLPPLDLRWSTVTGQIATPVTMTIQGPAKGLETPGELRPTKQGGFEGTEKVLNDLRDRLVQYVKENHKDISPEKPPENITIPSLSIALEPKSAPGTVATVIKLDQQLTVKFVLDPACKTPCPADAPAPAGKP